MGLNMKMDKFEDLVEGKDYLKDCRIGSMIDTDKYEGHTPAPWYHHMDDYVEALDLDVPLSVCTLAEGEHKDVNARLIADAPLLLEEVKKLREENHNRWVVIGELRRQVEELKADLGE